MQYRRANDKGKKRKKKKKKEKNNINKKQINTQFINQK